VARELAAADIPVILTQNRGGPNTFRTKDAVVGPPLTRSVASHLKEAGVLFGISIVDQGKIISKNLRSRPDTHTHISLSIDSMKSDFRIHNLLPEANWAGRYANLTEDEVFGLVTTNMEKILNLPTSTDLVVFEGNPLNYGATVVLTTTSKELTYEIDVVICLPREDDTLRDMRMQD